MKGTVPSSEKNQARDLKSCIDFMLRFCQVRELLLQADGITHVFSLSLREEKMLEKMLSIVPATLVSRGKTTFLEMSALFSHRR